MNQELLTRVGDYEVLGVLGTGGMGKVYKVRNVITDRIEAMKILLPNLADRRELGERFLREIRVLAGLNHPNIATLRTALTCEDRLLMVMEYVEGVTLATRLQQGPLSPAEAVDCVGQVLEALSYAHRLHIIHRDIKPANMMLTPAGVIKLMDFGIARSQGDPSLTATGTTVGSLHYMSPEQINGRELDERSDLYSLGVSLYEMVTGHRPFEGDSDYALMAAHLQKQPKPPLEMRPDLPPVLNEIILKAMAKDPAQRFQSADAFRAALDAVASSTVAASAAQADNGDTVRLDDFSPAGAFASAARSQAAPVQEPVMRAPSAPAARALTSPQAVPDSAPPVEPPPKARVPSVMEMSREVGNRGLYLTVGVIMLLLAVIAGALYLPHMRAARSSGKSVSVAPPVTPPKSKPAETHSAVASAPSSAMAASVPSAPPATVPNAPPKPATDEKPALATTAAPSTANQKGSIVPPPATTAHAPVPTPRHQGRMAAKSAANPKSSVRPQTEERAALSIPAKPAAPDTSQLQQLEHELDLLGSRAEAVNTSLDGMRQGQAAQGLGLRGDIASSQQRMRTYIGKAQSALKSQDPNATKKYLDLAETEVANLEKFLGR